MRRGYGYRLYPTKAQVLLLEKQLGEACDLYNAALQQRKEAWREHGASIGMFAQAAELKDLRAAGLLDAGTSYPSQLFVLHQLDHAFQAFFRRAKAGEKPGYPRFRSRSRYNTLSWRADTGWRLRGDRLSLKGIGAVRLRLHREIPDGAVVRRVLVTRTAGRWYARFTIDTATHQLPATGCAVGIDLGITTFAATSNGELLVGPRAYRKAQAELRVAQRRVAGRRRGSNRRRKAVVQLQRKHERIRRIRADHAHKLAAGLVHEPRSDRRRGLECSWACAYAAREGCKRPGLGAVRVLPARQGGRCRSRRGPGRPKEHQPSMFSVRRGGLEAVERASPSLRLWLRG